jgi:chromosome partitioning protein
LSATISLLNMKGGVGKTTLAVNLAWHMHQKEKSNVLLVDLDPQFNATQYVMDYKAFQIHRRKAGTIADLLTDPPSLTLHLKKIKSNPKATLHSIRSSGGKRLDIVPSELGLAWVVKNPAQMDYRLEKLLSNVRDDYDYVFVDCAPTDSVLTTMALTASDYLLIPMRPDRFSILGFANLIETIKTFRVNCPDPHSVKVLGIVFTQVSGTSEVEQQAMDELRVEATKEKTYLFSSRLKYSNSFIRSVRDQTPIFETLYAHANPKSAVGKIADELKTRIDHFQNKDKDAKGKN